jgi:hypothetical protein
MAWMWVDNGLLDSKKYLTALTKGWKAMANESVYANDFLGFLQGTGKQPSDSQPVTSTLCPI